MYCRLTRNSLPITDLLPRIYALHDDGHVSKLIRAIGICREASKAFEDKDKPRLHIKGEAVWTKVNQLVVDSVEGAGPKWVRGAGYSKTWTVNLSLSPHFILTYHSPVIRSGSDKN